MIAMVPQADRHERTPTAVGLSFAAGEHHAHSETAMITAVGLPVLRHDDVTQRVDLLTSRSNIEPDPGPIPARLDPAHGPC
jgi:hypothetical protein